MTRLVWVAVISILALGAVMLFDSHGSPPEDEGIDRTASVPAEAEGVVSGENAAEPQREPETRMLPNDSASDEPANGNDVQDSPGDTMVATRSAADRSSEIDRMFREDPMGLAQKVDAWMASQPRTEEQDQYTRDQVADWLASGLPDTATDFSIECVSDACYIDYATTHAELMRTYGQRTGKWPSEHLPGFLRSYFYVRAGEDYFRAYIFRDTFDPARL